MTVRSLADEDILEADPAVLPLGHNGTLEDNRHASLGREVVRQLSCDPLLQIECIQRGENDTDESRGADDNPDDGPN